MAQPDYGHKDTLRLGGLMRAFLLSLFMGVLYAPAAFSGGGDFDQYPPQQQYGAPQTKVIIEDRRESSDEGSSFPWEVVVASIGTAGTLGAAYIGVRFSQRKK